ncbi:hypothetical protein MCOR02_001765 [Pyricularia oryzae]|uniref:Uncharacterized protein n=4 Tax=Pyricularia oryzae TaxID=318829 RepID=G4MV46_PYRO7|nr:uncharacterized protein MGG_15594 [Pyricularia oryzae 70-15]ELQ42141.1 hypothetical protein OOU_Y34scaffold00228g32 [Pyricularia oryzae Y34]KAH9438125.1 hypothetical protein MCOR02_001765 [Pyricularia oryzae]EHA54061.1 hypothetical protein MGG_15594 [Pyricularia oryzae 70-15]KAI6271223.1 hypothetical protein MCOR26_007909 [Pyricularia oryzae]KAI6281526.1 hypothetical protein MCOR34_011121 [Pyricularia oryzae]
MPTYLGKLLMNVGGHLRIGDLTRQAKVGGSFGRLRNPPSGNHSRTKYLEAKPAGRWSRPPTHPHPRGARIIFRTWRTRNFTHPPELIAKYLPVTSLPYHIGSDNIP